MSRYLGVDLHRNCFTVCTIVEGGRSYVREWRLKDLGRFVSQLRCTDECSAPLFSRQLRVYN